MRVRMNSFGTFIKENRIKKQISLRAFSKRIGISPVYASSIENGTRTAPSYDLLKKMCNVLLLNKNEQEKLFDLAAKSKHVPSIACDLTEYVNSHELIYELLRTAKRYNACDDDWQYFIDSLSKKYQ